MLINSQTLLVLAQEPDAEVDFFVDPGDTEEPLTVGDQIILRLEVNHSVGSSVVLPQLGSQWGAIEIINQSSPETRDNKDGTATTGKDIIATIFEPGKYHTPRLVVTHRRLDRSMEELAAPVISLNVTSVLTDDTTLRDIKPQVELPEPLVWPWVIFYTLLVMFLTSLVVAASLWLYHRLRTEPLPEQFPLPIIDTRPPEVIAHTELDRIEALNLPAQNLIKEHYTLVADCLRFYVEGRYNIPAREQTSAELRTAFRKSTVPMRDVAAFMSILSESDFVKFARYKPQTEEVYSLINRARVVVDATTPAPELIEPATRELEVAA